jgi:carboxylate-amine ligase
MVESRRTAPLETILEHLSLQPTADRQEMISFESSGRLTLGVEIELQLINPETWNLASRAEELLERAERLPNITKEFYLSTVEINSGKCADAHEVGRDLIASLEKLEEIGRSLGIEFSATGCHPFAHYADCIITPTPRYHELIDRNQWLTRRMTVYGMHVHIGMGSGDECIRFNNFFLHFLPHLLALSASSPFWQGSDTGLASCRPTTYEALPTAGQPYVVHSWREFGQLCATLKACDAIQSLKDLWWDLRPSPTNGTLEIRICDGLASMAETLAVVAFVHALAHWFQDHGSWLEQVPPPPRWLARENKWRAMRYGLDAKLVTSLDGAVKPLREDILDWCKRISASVAALGYDNEIATLRQIMTMGNSSMRQRAVFARTGSLEQVVQHSIAEFRSRAPIWDPSFNGNGQAQ